MLESIDEAITCHKMYDTSAGDFAGQNVGIRKNKNLNIMINFDDMTGVNRQKHTPH